MNKEKRFVLIHPSSFILHPLMVLAVRVAGGGAGGGIVRPLILCVTLTLAGLDLGHPRVLPSGRRKPPVEEQTWGFRPPLANTGQRLAFLATAYVAAAAAVLLK